LFFCQNKVTTGINIAGSHSEYMVAYADATQLLLDGFSYYQTAPIFCGLRIATIAVTHSKDKEVGIQAWSQ
jgi:D-arabinose 1-dehydrogenase-like Zn-dependent alcohol dehydrogenase